jgi:BolA family transcriptional regulator, general stress-responsive regulator
MITAQEIEGLLKTNLGATQVRIQDDGASHIGHQPGDPAYLTIEVTSPNFQGKTLVQQHRLVYNCLKEQLKEQIHALAIKTKVA